MACGQDWTNAVRCSISFCPFVLSLVRLLWRPILKRCSRDEPIDQNGKKLSLTRNASTSTWLRDVGFATTTKVPFVCQPEVSMPPIVVAARGLTKADLMGDLAMLLQLPAYQLAFPFFSEDQRRLALVECLCGTAS